MDLGERTVTTVPGTLDLDGFFTIVAERILDHALKKKITSNERNVTPAPKKGEKQ